MNVTSIQLRNTVGANLCDHIWLDFSDYNKLKINLTYGLNVKMPNVIFQTDHAT
jgi:hypothetical protein